MSWLVFAEVAGGVALFLVGMQWLSAALRELAGDRLRAWLTAATESRMRGVFLGTAFGALAHSSAASVLIVGFVHAGLLTLAGALPLLFGANLGTTLSMQLVSFRLTDYALAATALGGMAYLFGPDGRTKIAGRAVLGFGMLFLGMKISGEAIVPYRAELAPLLAGIDGQTWSGMLIGLIIAAAITGLVQSSGAIIGMTFVLAGSGVITSLAQAYPIILGAHVGTTVTGLIASIGTSPEARRAAFGNTLFNVCNASLGAAGGWVLIPLLERTSGVLVRQIANTHTAIMLIATAIALPLTGLLARLLRRTFFAGAQEQAGSFLSQDLLDKPEDALVATLHELGRSASLCVRSFSMLNQVFDGGDPKALRRVRLNEHSLDEIKTSVRAFLARLAGGYLSRRQAFLAQSLNRCMIEVERIGDHIDKMATLAGQRSHESLAQLDEQTASAIRDLAGSALSVVDTLARTLQTKSSSFSAAAAEVIAARDRYIDNSLPLRGRLNERLAQHELRAKSLLAFSEYAAAMDRIVRHCGVIAQEQSLPAFALKPGKFGRPRGPRSAKPGDL